MSDKVSSLIDITERAGCADDAWGDFRGFERITLELKQRYHYSLGRQSRFFIELENRRFFATACASCGRVYAPPRPLCPACLQPTTWRELSGEGSLETWSALHFSPGTNADVAALQTPYVLAYALLDGASTLFPHLLRAEGESLRQGMRLRVAYNEGPVSHPIHLMHFAPA
ncbi:MAG: Zn-ribbon domain-containing OB-fold protein [Chloroflexi bacterium]|nr:Zn-ribbon domain-containing OB-fold protein [Chloroflexota bacterium]MCY4248454.1 Zn-ribbon domain-containing OB-fold protein [Chloroflexota bacterium]